VPTHDIISSWLPPCGSTLEGCSAAYSVVCAGLFISVLLLVAGAYVCCVPTCMPACRVHIPWIDHKLTSHRVSRTKSTAQLHACRSVPQQEDIL
jgi:hypothetical protein